MLKYATFYRFSIIASINYQKKSLEREKIVVRISGVFFNPIY